MGSLLHSWSGISLIPPHRELYSGVHAQGDMGISHVTEPLTFIPHGLRAQQQN